MMSSRFSTQPAKTGLSIRGSNEMNAADVMKLIEEKDIKFVDYRFTDTRGKEPVSYTHLKRQPPTMAV